MSLFKMYTNKPINEYLGQLASKSPVPGGGSAAALSAAIGAALLSKVANFTIGKEKYKAVEEQMRDILSRSQVLGESFSRLCSEDAIIYKKLSQTFKLPKETPTEREERQKRIQEALKEAIAVPLEVCKDVHQAIKLCPALAEKGNVNLISDVGVAVLLLESAFQSAILNVQINLNSLKDPDFIVKIREMLEPLEKEIRVIKDQVWQTVKNKMTQETK